MNGSAYVAAVLFGVIAGLRTFTAPAGVTWAVYFGRLDLTGSWLAFLGNAWVRWLLTGLALSSTGVYSAHADFFNAWRQDELERLVASCLNALRHCGRDG